MLSSSLPPPGRGPDSEYWCGKADLSVAPIWMMVRMDEDEDKRFSRRGCCLTDRDSTISLRDYLAPSAIVDDASQRANPPGGFEFDRRTPPYTACVCTDPFSCSDMMSTLLEKCLFAM